jgi:hypothetical protein
VAVMLHNATTEEYLLLSEFFRTEGYDRDQQV